MYVHCRGSSAVVLSSNVCSAATMPLVSGYLAARRWNQLIVVRCTVHGCSSQMCASRALQSIAFTLWEDDLPKMLQ